MRNGRSVKRARSRQGSCTSGLISDRNRATPGRSHPNPQTRARKKKKKMKERDSHGRGGRESAPSRPAPAVARPDPGTRAGCRGAPCTFPRVVTLTPPGGQGPTPGPGRLTWGCSGVNFAHGQGARPELGDPRPPPLGVGGGG